MKGKKGKVGVMVVINRTGDIPEQYTISMASHYIGHIKVENGWVLVHYLPEFMPTNKPFDWQQKVELVLQAYVGNNASTLDPTSSDVFLGLANYVISKKVKEQARELTEKE